MQLSIAYFALAGCLAGQTQNSDYAGAQACSACHVDIAKRQEVSSHARSLRAPAEIPEIVLRLPFETRDKTSGATLILRRGPDGNLELAAQKARSEDRMTLKWAFGSGTKGITPVGIRANGELAESRLTWYRSLGSFDLTTGAAKLDPHTLSENLGRPLRQDDLIQCLSCHTTGGSPQAMGIRCERCHGPGQEHVRTRQHKSVLQPGRLDGFAQAQMCGVCHGRPPEDTDLATIRMIQQAPNTVRFPSQRLVLSRCFNESDGGIRCTACHDPHSDGVRATDAACVECHQKGLRARVKMCQVAKSGCVSCHMPKEQVMAHSSFTDHWIRVGKQP